MEVKTPDKSKTRRMKYDWDLIWSKILEINKVNISLNLTIKKPIFSVGIVFIRNLRCINIVSNQKRWINNDRWLGWQSSHAEDSESTARWIPHNKDNLYFRIDFKS